MAETDKRQLSVWLPVELYTELQRIAAREDSTLSREGVIAVRAHVDSHKQRRARG